MLTEIDTGIFFAGEFIVNIAKNSFLKKFAWKKEDEEKEKAEQQNSGKAKV